MARKAAAGIPLSVWRSWAARIVPRPLVRPAEPADLESRRMMAEQRAVAAEIIAQEANAVRLQTLLDAARSEAANRNIRTAEERFSAAKVRWERVRQGLRPEPEPDPYAEADEPATPPQAAPSLASVAGWRAAVGAGLVRPKDVWLAGLPMLALAGVAAAAVHFHFQSRPMTAVEPAAMPPAPRPVLETPAEAPAAGAAAPLSAPVAMPNGLGGAVEPRPKAEAPAVLKPAPVARRKPAPPVLPQPPQASEAEALAVSVPVPAEPMPPLPRAE
jgi:hypothetical protein